jgi:hypothetical protein
VTSKISRPATKFEDRNVDTHPQAARPGINVDDRGGGMAPLRLSRTQSLKQMRHRTQVTTDAARVTQTLSNANIFFGAVGAKFQ